MNSSSIRPFLARVENRLAKRVNNSSPVLEVLLALALALLFAPFADAQLQDVNCGALNQRICTTNDVEYYVANTRSPSTICDYGLLPMPNPSEPAEMICSNLSRNSLKNIFNTSDPRGFVIHEQEEAVGADVPINLVNTLGTHNSYSSYREGYDEDYHLLHFDLSSLSFSTLEDPWAADQYYSISDQLNAGARTIRIDPYFYDGELRLCHGPMYCDTTSNGRLFVYAIREVSDWLQAHPGEFITLGLNDYKIDQSQQALEIAAIQKYLSPVLYTPNDGLADYLAEGNTQVFPTLRQLRAMGKQVMIFSTFELNNYAWVNNTYWSDDTSAKNLVPGQNLSLGPGCLDDSKNDPRHRPILGWNNVGEDRSGSMLGVWKTSSFPFFAAGNTSGLMDDTATAIAAKCGASVIDLDFWGALNHAFHFDVNVFGQDVTLVDFRGPDDDRPLAASWSYITNDSVVGPAALGEKTQNWVSLPESVSLRYACAAQRETPDVWYGLYDWVTTSIAGPWSGGEAACQKLGSQYHFWFPGSVYEQSNLLRYDMIHRAALTDDIWLNYRSATTGHQLMTAPSQLSVVTGAGTLPTHQTIWVSGGSGGKLRVTTSGPFRVEQQMAGTWPTNQFVLKPEPDGFNHVGTQTQKIQIEEIDPSTNQIGYTNTIPVTITVKDTLVPNMTTVHLAPGTVQSVEVRGYLGTSDHIQFRLGQLPNWLRAEVDSSQTPATIKFSAKTMPAGIYLGSVELIPSGGNSGDELSSITVEYVVK